MPTHPMDDNNRLRVDLQPIHQYEHKGVFQAHLDIDIRSVATQQTHDVQITLCYGCILVMLGYDIVKTSVQRSE